ncbi:MAG: NAD(P)-dependent alcohol dehydrogenase [Thermodesulfobacteriota bacterium]
MMALFLTSYGGPEVLRYGELPDPSPTRGELLVAVKAASLNPLDFKIRRGDIRVVTGSRFPKVLGADFAGVVREAGRGVSGFRPGDAVYGFTPLHLRKPGAHAEFVPVDARRARAIPDGISFEEAATLPVAALTALNGLRRCGDLAGKAVLINGATGGVGHFALRIAKARGASVTAVCSARNMDFARELGADVVIDYASHDVTLDRKAYDIVFDAHASLGFAKAARILSPDGVYATTLPTPGVLARLLWRKMLGGRRIVAANMRARPEDYMEMELLIREGKVRPVIGAVFPLREGARAFDALESVHVRGKIVLVTDLASIPGAGAAA